MTIGINPVVPLSPPLTGGTKGRVVHENESTAGRGPRTIQPRVPSRRHTPNLGGAPEAIRELSQGIDQVTLRTNICLSPWLLRLGPPALE